MRLTVTSDEAKALIADRAGVFPSQVEITYDPMPEDFLVAIHEGLKLQAIKILRTKKSCGLRQAKEAVDAFYKAYHSFTPPIYS